MLLRGVAGSSISVQHGEKLPCFTSRMLQPHEVLPGPPVGVPPRRRLVYEETNSRKRWYRLSHDEKAAAQSLGFTPNTWNDNAKLIGQESSSLFKSIGSLNVLRQHQAILLGLLQTAADNDAKDTPAVETKRVEGPCLTPPPSPPWPTLRLSDSPTLSPPTSPTPIDDNLIRSTSRSGGGDDDDDSCGTIPVSAVTGPVGLKLSKAQRKKSCSKAKKAKKFSAMFTSQPPGSAPNRTQCQTLLPEFQEPEFPQQSTALKLALTHDGDGAIINQLAALTFSGSNSAVDICVNEETLQVTICAEDERLLKQTAAVLTICRHTVPVS